MLRSWLSVIFLVLLALVIRAEIDISLWQRIFESDICKAFWDVGESCKYVGRLPGQYHYGLYFIDFGLAVVGMLGLWFGGKFLSGIVYSYSFIHMIQSGASDILYYWLDGNSVPENMDWLWFTAPFVSNQMTDEALFINVIYNIVMLFIGFGFLYKLLDWRKRN